MNRLQKIVLSANWTTASKVTESLEFHTEFPELKQVHRMIQDFLSIVHEKRAESLANWLITYKNIP
ncbi:hypothetical protein [Bacillus cereus group sp. BfR-BA-01380]|uniref:hypothetical protein n=1 Tax=Bacillus cereus group sp. BfR-BA-01380 TaxID=2920324 RepID=UPI001F57E857|nr:hypothetical protein [Bacillus cereus group sp. BfR-BA-01380]